MKTVNRQDLVKITETEFEIPPLFDPSMRVGARIFTTEAMLNEIIKDRSLQQICNVATLPGIQKYAYAMPDIHQGYGFPIGGVAATAIDEEGIISPGGIGYDINCGVRLLTLSLSAKELMPQLPALADALFQEVPSGVGRSGELKLTSQELDHVLLHGARALINRGLGNEDDLAHCEEEGTLGFAEPANVSEKAKMRGIDQVGTLGSGNHFLEIQKITEIFDPEIAKIFGLELNGVTVMIHCGSRGLGHQVCTDYVDQMVTKLSAWNIELPDKELACAPFNSPEGQQYFSAMCAAANFAWANRHMIGHQVRSACHKILGSSIEVRTVYDVSHNIGKKETHPIGSEQKELLVHRKGATRAFPAHHPAVPLAYRRVGHPVLIPGTMGTSSYVMVGTEQGLLSAFGSCCHGAGRTMSRMQAKKQVRGKELRAELEARGILIRCESDRGLAEEAPFAYKSIEDVTHIITAAHLARPVAKCVPLAVIKGG